MVDAARRPAATNHEHHAPRSGRIELPRRLWKLLPAWQRRWSALLVTPPSIGAIAAFVLNDSITGSILLVMAGALHLARFWAARAFLIRQGKWEQGSWYAEVLPSIYRWRAILMALLVLSGVGAFLVLEGKVHVQGLKTITVVALALLVPAYVRSSIVLGYIGNWPINHYRSDEPDRFWMGLATYAGLIALLCAMVIYVVLGAAGE